MTNAETKPDFITRRQWVGLILAPVLGAIVLGWPAGDGFTGQMRVVLALTVLMAVLWIFESLPLAATALLPLVVLPLAGVAKPGEAAASYANDLIFLFIGGFILANGIGKWGLHRRTSLGLLAVVGPHPRMVVLAMMGLTAFVSLWISNTATALMMMPMGLSVLQTSRHTEKHFATSLVLGISAACTIGGMGTPIGSTPNLLFAAEMRNTHGVNVGFAEWMMLGIPLVIVFTLGAWVLLTFVLFPIKGHQLPTTHEAIEGERRALPGMSAGEVLSGVIFGMTALGWIFRERREVGGWTFGINALFPGVSDGTIAVAGALAMMVVPVSIRPGRMLLDWQTAAKIPWDIILLFGGGLCLADGIQRSGLDRFLVVQLGGLHQLPHILVLVLVVCLCVVLSEVASNTAAAALLLPLGGTLAESLGERPVYLMLPIALGTSLGLMLPVATPPNAIALGTGKISVREMMKAGFWLNVMGIVLIVAGCYLLGFRAYAGK